MSRIGAFRKWHYAESIFPTFNELGSEAHLMVNVSVTRFGELLLLRQNFNRLWTIFEDLFSIWQNSYPTKVYSYAIGQIFFVL